MKIENVRYGFACNSSSTHSIIIYPANQVKDDLCEDGEFGWAPFIASSPKAKKSYLKTLLINRLGHMGAETAKLVAEKFIPEDVPVGYIDHQSIPLIPRVYGSKDPSYEFFQDMLNYVLRNDVVIHGGNDNDCPHIPINGQEPDWYKKLPTEVTDDNWICRKEDDWWILFDTKCGMKITLSFKDNPKPRLVAEVPELVDLKITNYCQRNCEYCYQASSKDGKHADHIYPWLVNLAAFQVFEVALGGGEPTSHPEFKSILANDYISLLDLSINFTTRDLSWIKENADLIKGNGRHFAYSVDKVEEVFRASKIFQDLKMVDLATFQYVMGTSSDEAFIRIINTCRDEGFGITLLGYKKIGRGKSWEPKGSIQNQATVWLPLLRSMNWYSGLGIDTALAKGIAESELPEYLLRRTEGTHSMYIDAVSNKAGKDSYSGNLVDVTLDNIIKVFKSFR